MPEPQNVHTDPRADSSSRSDRTRLNRTAYPGIYRRGERYVVIWRHQGRQHKKTYPSLAEALAAQALHRGGETRPGAPSSLILRNYVREWLASYPGYTYRGLADSTRADYQYSLEHYILPRLGAMRITTIRPRDIRRLVGEMEAAGLQPSTITKHLAPLKALFATALADGDVDRNPTLRVYVSGRNRDPNSTVPKALTSDEVRRLLAELEPPWDLMVEFLVHTGLRVSEAIALTWADLNLGPNPSVCVTRQYYKSRLRQPKSRGSIRRVPLSPNTAGRLRDLRATQAAREGDLVFPNARGGYVDPHNLRARIIRPAAAAAGLGRVSPHMLRHTCASLLFEHGRNIKQVQEWLGHHDAAVTLRVYIHLVDRGTGDAGFFDAITSPG